MQILLILLGWVVAIVILILLANIVSLILAAIFGPFARVDFDDSFDIVKTSMIAAFFITFFAFGAIERFSVNDALVLFISITVGLHVIRVAIKATGNVDRQRALDERQKEQAEEKAIRLSASSESHVVEAEPEEIVEKESVAEKIPVTIDAKTVTLDELLSLVGYHVVEYGDVFQLLEQQDERTQVIGKYLSLKELTTDLKRIVKELNILV